MQCLDIILCNGECCGVAGDVCIPAVLIGCPRASAVYNAEQSVGWVAG